MSKKQKQTSQNAGKAPKKHDAGPEKRKAKTCGRIVNAMNQRPRLDFFGNYEKEEVIFVQE
jgi:hypothetical protein